VGCDTLRWHGATTLRADARKEKQQSRRSAAQCNRVRSALTHKEWSFAGQKICVHAV